MKYAPKLQDLLLMLCVMTKVKVIDRDYKLIATGGPTYLFNHLSNETLNRQIVVAHATNINEITVMLTRGK